MCDDTVTTRDEAVTSASDQPACLSDDLRLVFQVVNFAIICQIINVWGTAANIINIVCFVKQGLKDPVNISLLGLTVSELLSSCTLIWQDICLNPLFYQADIPFMAQSMAYLTGGILHVACTRVTCCVTAYIGLERCLCVLRPFKVKQILSAKRTVMILVSIYALVLSSNLGPTYYTTRFAMVPHPHKPNTTWLDFIFTEDRPVIDRYASVINNCFVPFTAFTLISVSTAALVYSLRRHSKRRNMSLASVENASLSTRDRAVSRMVVMISTTFIICYMPVCAIFIGMVAVPEFSILGRCSNLNAVLVSFSYILESMNLSLNICVYYKTSSRYRRAFRLVIC